MPSFSASTSKALSAASLLSSALLLGACASSSEPANAPLTMRPAPAPTVSAAPAAEQPGVFSRMGSTIGGWFSRDDKAAAPAAANVPARAASADEPSPSLGQRLGNAWDSLGNSGSSLISGLTPYRIDIPQGNWVTREMAGQLQVGMNRDQVRFVLGTPMLADMFHADRWDYPFRFRRGNGEVIERNFTVYFQNNRMQRFVGDDLPSDAEFFGLGKTAAERTAAQTARTPFQAPLLPGQGGIITPMHNSDPTAPAQAIPPPDKNTPRPQ